MSETFSAYVDGATPRNPNGSELVTLTVGTTTYSATVSQIVSLLLGTNNTWTGTNSFTNLSIGTLTAATIAASNIAATSASVTTLITTNETVATSNVTNLTATNLTATNSTLSNADVTGVFQLAGNAVSFTGGTFIGTLTGTTNVTFPTSGTLATIGGNNNTSVQVALNNALPDIPQDQLYGGTDMYGVAQPVFVGAGLTVDIDGSVGDDDTVDGLATDVYPRLYVSGLPMAFTSQLYGGTGGWGVAQPVSLGAGLGMSGGVLGTQVLAVIYTPDTELVKNWLS
jgi:hypothetical protein